MTRPIVLALLLAAPVQAAGLYTIAEPPNPADYFKVQPEYISRLSFPRSYSLLSVSDPYSPDHNAFGWQQFWIYAAHQPGTFPPDWRVLPVYIPKADGFVLLRPSANVQTHRIDFDFTEFMAAGDSELRWIIDGDLGGNDGDVNGTTAWNTLHLISPNLGAVTRTYVVAPEPAGWALLAMSGLMLRRRKRQSYFATTTPAD